MSVGCNCTLDLNPATQTFERTQLHMMCRSTTIWIQAIESEQAPYCYFEHALRTLFVPHHIDMTRAYHIAYKRMRREYMSHGSRTYFCESDLEPKSELMTLSWL